MKNAYRRDPLAKERARGLRDRMDRIRQTMTPAQIEASMKKIIRNKLELDETIALDDFRLANLPLDQVNAMFRRVLQSVQNAMAMERG